MNVPLVVIIVIATAAAVSAGIAFTYRGFKASDARATNGGNKEGHQAADAASAAISRHDPATDNLLKRFFDGKACAICKRPIPPVQRSGLKPGLFNPVTHETHSWDQIPNGNLSAMLEKELPICSSCQVAESFRQRFPDRVVDRDRPSHDAQAAGRIGASS